MRDFLLDPQDRAFRSEVRDFLRRELLPRAAAIEERDDWDAVKAVVRSLGEAGYLKLMFTDLYRGALSKPGLTHATILSEEAAYINYGFETTIGTALSCAYPLHRHASPAIRERYLSGIVDGRKRYISNAAVADVYMVYGVTDSTKPPGKGLSAVAVPSATPGVSIPCRYTFMGRRGHRTNRCAGHRGGPARFQMGRGCYGIHRQERPVPHDRERGRLLPLRQRPRRVQAPPAHCVCRRVADQPQRQGAQARTAGAIRRDSGRLNHRQNAGIARRLQATARRIDGGKTQPLWR